MPSSLIFAARALAVAACAIAWFVPVCRAQTKAETAKVSNIMIQTPPLAVANVIALQAKPFNLSDVRLLDGPFKAAMQRDLDYLLALEPDRFLSGFRSCAGLEPKAPKYGGWESQGVAGQTLGHYLSACAMAYAATGDARYQERTEYIVGELALCQAQREDGYTGAWPDNLRVWSEVAAGDVRSDGFDLNGGWVPWYPQHKVLAGFIDAYEQTGNETAKIAALKLADWTIFVTRNLDEAKWQKMLACEHGGMNESLAQIYAWTGDKKYLEISEKFHHDAVLNPLARGDASVLPGLHANTQIPKLIGLARQYELTGDESDKMAATTFWNSVVHEHSYAIGGNSSGEHFSQPKQLSDRLTESTCETCNTYNMLKLSGHLFEWQPDAAIMDFAERALYNHILASQNSNTGAVCYYVSLEQGGSKRYMSLFDAFTCCVGTGMENHVKYSENIYFHNNDSLWINLFIPSVLSWKQKGLSVKQETEFPNQGASKLMITTDKPTKLNLRVRYPDWVAPDALKIRVNGVAQPIAATPGSYVSIERVWSDGDVVEIELPMTLRTEPMPDNDRRVALLYGPIVLAGKLDSADGKKPQIPVFVEENQPLARWIAPIAAQPLTFSSVNVGRPDDVTFVPFFQIRDERYSVYFDLFTPAQWQAREAKYRAEEARQTAMEARTIDFFQPGEMQPERDHNLRSQNSNVGEASGRKWRDANEGGWFSFDLKTDGDNPQDLVLDYWGGEQTQRVFDILIDGEIVATQTLFNNQPGEFFDVTHVLKPELLRGKSRITVRLQAHAGGMAGGLFGARLLRRN